VSVANGELNLSQANYDFAKALEEGRQFRVEKMTEP